MKEEGFYREMPDVTAAVQAENLNMNVRWKNQQRPPVKQAFKAIQLLLDFETDLCGLVKQG